MIHKEQPQKIGDTKKPKRKPNRRIRVSREIQEKIKKVAIDNNFSSYRALYEKIVDQFVDEAKKSKKDIKYLFPLGKNAKLTIELNTECMEGVKIIAVRDLVPDTIVIFTAIMDFASRITN